MHIKRLLSAASAGLLVAVALPASVFAAESTVVVKPSNTNGWTFFQETATGSGSFVNGPSTPPLGNGSANLTVDSTGGEALAKAAFQNTTFSSITTLK